MGDIFTTLISIQPSSSRVEGEKSDRLPGVTSSTKNGLYPARPYTYRAYPFVRQAALNGFVQVPVLRSSRMNGFVQVPVLKSASINGDVVEYQRIIRQASLNANVIQPSTLLTGLLAYWTLDGNSVDAKGTYNGTDTNVSYVSGKIGQAASFNGSSSRIDFGSSIPFDSNNWTMASWVKAPQNNGRFFCYYGDGPTFWRSGYLAIVHGASIDFNFGFDLDNTWQHMVITRSGSTITSYLNAVQKAQNTSFGSVFSAINGGVSLGYSTSAYHEYWAGTVDEAGIWGRALTQAEVTELYNTGIGKQYPFL